jgi:tetratricopeptide (TPR) repeat protein
MRKILIAFWFLVPVAMAAYHFGPGQDQLVLDEANREMALAQKAVDDLEYDEALERFDNAISLLPDGEKDALYRIRLEKAKVQMTSRKLPDAHEALSALMTDLEAEENVAAGLAEGTRESLANSQYYMTWLMRLEGVPRETWEKEIEASRQNYKLLAENATPVSAKRHQESLESAVRLARMDLADLQGLPLPSQ